MFSFVPSPFPDDKNHVFGHYAKHFVTKNQCQLIAGIVTNPFIYCFVTSFFRSTRSQSGRLR